MSTRLLYVIRIQPGLYTSICPLCLKTVCAVGDQAQQDEAQRNHKCAPEQLRAAG